MASYARARRIHKPGRVVAAPEPVTIPALDVFLHHYERTLNEREARLAAGLSLKDLAQARLDDPEFVTACADLNEQLVDKIEARGFEIARDDPTMIRWLLEHLRPAKYGKKSTIDLNVRDLSKLSDEELDTYINQLKR
jgi:hypothetical protein